MTNKEAIEVFENPSKHIKLINGQICYSRFFVEAMEMAIKESKTGHWIFVDKAHEHAYCSKCGYGNVDLLDGRPHNYCPNCGYRMIDPQERSDKGMTIIDVDKIITVQLYDDEYEEFKEEQTNIIDFVNIYTTEGVTIADDVLDKMRADILKISSYNGFELGDFKDGYTLAMARVLKIIDNYKYKAEVEQQKWSEKG